MLRPLILIMLLPAASCPQGAVDVQLPDQSAAIQLGEDGLGRCRVVVEAQPQQAIPYHLKP